MSPRWSPFDLTDRRASGHPNGYCLECGRPAVSLRADFCSPGCRGRHAAREQQASAIERQAKQEVEELQRARAVAGPEGQGRD